MEYLVTKGVEGASPSLLPYNEVRGEWILSWVFGTDIVQTILPYKPTIDQIKVVVVDWYKTMTDNEVLQGFEWKGLFVNLTNEDKLNYKVLYDIAYQTQGKSLPTTIKFGTDTEPQFHEFTTLEEFTEFYLTTLKFVEGVYQKWWTARASIDWSKYESLV